MDSMRKVWKYLEEHFDTNLNELQTRLQELQIREEEISNREKRLEDRESELECLDKLIEYKGEEYDAMEEAITEKELQVEQVKTELQSISLLVEEKSQELDSKEKRVLEVEELLRKKDKECALMQNRIEEGRNNLIRVEKSIREMDIKVKTSMEDWSGKVDLKERQIEGLLKPNVEQLLLAYNMIKEYFKEVERKERGLKQQAKDLESKEREVALKVDELKLTETRVKKRLNNVQLKEKHFDSLEKSLKADKQHLGSLLKSIEECKKDLALTSHQLQMKERELAQQAKELELKQKQFSSQAKTKHLEPAPADNNATVPSSTIDHSCINIDVMSNKEEPESSPTRNAANLQPNTTRDDRNVPGLLNENFSCNHSVQSDLAAYLRSVPDLAKVVLNSMQNSIRPYLRKGYFEESVMSRNISLLKELMIVSPHVGSHMKENARYLATQWKIKMRGNTENSVESLAYFLFITMYELDFMLNGDEIVKLLLVISQTITALELCQTHGFAAKMIGIIWNLIERGRLIEAVRFICSFKLTEKLPPVPLLKEYVEDAKKFCEIFCEKKISLDLKAEFVDNKIGGLKAVQQCIKDYNLECEYPAADIQMQVVQFERMKEKWRSPAPNLGSNVKQKGQRKRKRPNYSSSTPESQPQQQK